jgi:hypothetical protein
MEKCTIYMGLHVAQFHSAIPGRGQVSQPKSSAFGWPKPLGHSQSVLIAFQHVVTVVVHAHSIGRGTAVAVSTALENRRDLGQNHPWDWDNTALHQKLNGLARKEGLTCESFRAAGEDGGELDNQYPGRWKLFGSVLQLHEKAKDMRQWSGPLAGDEKHEGRCSQAVGSRWVRDLLGRADRWGGRRR